jgi:hypothetical protein
VSLPVSAVTIDFDLGGVANGVETVPATAVIFG